LAQHTLIKAKYLTDVFLCVFRLIPLSEQACSTYQVLGGLMKVTEGVGKYGGVVYCIEKNDLYVLYFDALSLLHGGYGIYTDLNGILDEFGFDLVLLGMHVKAYSKIPDPGIYLINQTLAAQSHSVATTSLRDHGGGGHGGLGHDDNDIGHHHDRHGGPGGSHGPGGGHGKKGQGVPSSVNVVNVTGASNTVVSSGGHGTSGHGAGGHGTHNTASHNAAIATINANQNRGTLESDPHSAGGVVGVVEIPQATMQEIQKFVQRVTNYEFRGFFCLGFESTGGSSGSISNNSFEHDFVLCPVEKVLTLDLLAKSSYTQHDEIHRGGRIVGAREAGAGNNNASTQASMIKTTQNTTSSGRKPPSLWGEKPASTVFHRRPNTIYSVHGKTSEVSPELLNCAARVQLAYKAMESGHALLTAVHELVDLLQNDLDLQAGVLTVSLSPQLVMLLKRALKAYFVIGGGGGGENLKSNIGNLDSHGPIRNGIWIDPNGEPTLVELTRLMAGFQHNTGDTEPWLSQFLEGAMELLATVDQ